MKIHGYYKRCLRSILTLVAVSLSLSFVSGCNNKITLIADIKTANSDPVTESVTNTGTVAAPVFTPSPGVYPTAQTVSLKTTTSGASIYYTTTGVAPTCTGTGTLYSDVAPILVGMNVSMTIKAIACLSGLKDSSVTSGTFAVTLTPSSLVLQNPLVSPGNIITPTITVGVVANGITVTLYKDSLCATPLVSGVATGSTINLTSPALADGTYNFYANTTDTLGNASPCSTATVAYTVDTVAPAAPNLLTLVTPAVSPGKITTPTISVGGVVAGDTVRLFKDACITQVASGMATATTISLTSSVLADAAYSFYANSTDPAGNVSVCSTATAAYTVDTTPPIAPNLLTLITPATSPGNINTPTISVGGVVAGDMVGLFTNAACTTQVATGVAAGTTISLTSSILTDAAYTFYANSADPLGNISTCSTATVAYTVDTTPPVPPNLLTLVTPVTSPGTNNTPTISVGGVVAGDTVGLFTNAACTAPAVSTGVVGVGATTISLTSLALTDAAYIFYANSADPLGNVSACSTAMVAYTVDTVVPAAPNLLSLVIPATTTGNNTSPTISVGGVVAGDTVRLFKDACITQVASGVVGVGATTINLTSSVLTAGAYNFYAISTDPAGNISTCSTATVAYTVDTTPPAVPNLLTMVTPLTSPGTNNTPTISVGGVVAGDTVGLFSNAACTIQVATGVVGVGATTINLTSSALTDAAYTFYANSTDPAGNTSACSTATVAYTVDTTPPTPPTLTLITPATSPGTNNTPMINVGGVVVGDTVRFFSDACVSQLASGVAAGTTISFTSPVLTPGTYTFYANSTDPLGHISGCSAVLTYTLDITPPTLVSALTLDNNNDGMIDYYKLTFSEAVSDASFPTTWIVSGHCNGVTTICSKDITTTTIGGAANNPNDNIIYLTLPPATVFDTGAKPDLTTTATPALTDLAGNVIAAIITITIVESDGAAPVVVGASGMNSLLARVSFSESLQVIGGATDYSVTSGAGTLAVSAVAILPGSSSIVNMTTATQTAATAYTVTVSNGSATIKDFATPTALVVNPSKNFASFTTGDFAGTISITVTGLISGNTLVLQDTVSMIPLVITGGGTGTDNGAITSPNGPNKNNPYYIVVTAQPAGTPQHCFVTSGAAGVTSPGPTVSMTCRPPNTTTATMVFGQDTAGTSLTTNNGEQLATNMWNPTGNDVDSTGGMYVVDVNNHRVLYYPFDPATGRAATTATRVYGQLGRFTTGVVNKNGISANSLNTPMDVKVDPAGGLYISDGWNYRVLHYSANQTTADVVYGGGTAPSATAISAISALAIDATGGLYVADRYCHRVLYFPFDSVSGMAATTATRVYGQGGSFTTGTANNGGVSANSLNFPQGVAVNPVTGGLYISDSNNHRILYYPAGSTTATIVYGQADFASNLVNRGGAAPSATSINNPRDVTSDSTGGLYVADYQNHRVLYYPPDAVTNIAVTTPTRVYGPGNFTTVGSCATPSNTTVCGPFDVAIGSGGIYIAEWNGNRVSYFPGVSTTASVVYGQGATGANSTTITSNYGGIGSSTLLYPMGIAFDKNSVTGGLYVTDRDNNRALFFPYNSGTGKPATIASRVYGPADGLGNNFTLKGSGLSQNTLNDPAGVAIDAVGGVYVTDTYLHRVLYYAPNDATPVGADRVYGQGGSFSTMIANNGGISANSLSVPVDVAVAPNGGLYVVDFNNHRVLYYASGSTTATRVYGQPAFNTAIAHNGGVSANSMQSPYGVAVDPGGNLYVADQYSHRVLYYPFDSAFGAAATTATRVYGQINFSSTAAVSNATGLFFPRRVAIDGAGGLYILMSFGRVLYYTAGSTTANKIYGQNGNFTGQASNFGAVSGTGDTSADGLSGSPYGLAIDASDHVFISDSINNRVLYY